VTRRSLHDDVTAELRTLGIALTPAAIDAALSAAERESLSHLEFLHRLLAEPAEARRQRALDRRLRDAKFRELTTLEGFDWEFNAKGVDRRTVEQLATCDFVRRRENVILVGQTGLGKSRILQAIGRAACVLGYRVRYVTSAKLIQELTAALADGSFTRTLDAYARLDLLLIDEFGFDRLEREAHAQASTVYYRLLDARTGRRSTALATNIDFKAWGPTYPLILPTSRPSRDRHLASISVSHIAQQPLNWSPLVSQSGALSACKRHGLRLLFLVDA